MESNSSEPLEGVDASEVTPGDVAESEVRAALEASESFVKQRGVNVCDNLADEDVDAVRPFIEDLGGVLDRTNGPVTLRAISALASVGKEDPAALEPALSDLAAVLDSQLVDVQLTAANVFGTIVVDRPDLCAPHAPAMIDALRDTELDPNPPDYSDVTDNRWTQRTLQEHEESERKRQISGRRILSNVLVAIAESEPESLFDSVEEFPTLFDDVDPGVSGGAIDALAELAQVDPDRVAPVGEELIDCLDHGRTDIRARAIRALGHLGADAAVPKLRDIAENDESEDVQVVAAETADYLEARE